MALHPLQAVDLRHAAPQGGGRKDPGHLGPGDGPLIIGEFSLGDDAAGHAVGHRRAVPGLGGHALEVEVVPQIPTLHMRGQLEGLSHGEGAVGVETVVPHALHQPHVIGHIHRQVVPVPGRHVGKVGQALLYQRKPGGGHLALHQQGGQGVHRHQGLNSPAGQHQYIQAVGLAYRRIVVCKGVELLSLPAEAAGEGHHAHHAPLIPLLGPVEAVTNGLQGVVLRLDQIGAVGTNESQLVVLLHPGHPQAEVHHRLVLDGNDDLPRHVGKAPQPALRSLGQALLVAPDLGRGQGGGGQDGRQQQGQGLGPEARPFHTSCSHPRSLL